MTLQFIQLTQADPAIVEVLNRWGNDPYLVPLTRPNQTQAEVEQKEWITVDDLNERLEDHFIYLIYLDHVLVGEMNYMIDPDHLYKKEQGTAWIGISIGEPEGRGKGIGYKALRYLEQQIKANGYQRIEIGVFEFNTQAHKLYKKLGYKEIARIPDFTYYNGARRADIRMEKYL
ncbi:GNAT family N-acetyltransferase [Halobacillus sp. B23F22_1]|uniref:GNAT family N-acetyltransferase n=1 Tax=Halobacillus sp. B23F22_1 TaxID=3459514 RepID=UPI00373FA541